MDVNYLKTNVISLNSLSSSLNRFDSTIIRAKPNLRRALASTTPHLAFARSLPSKNICLLASSTAAVAAAVSVDR
jgi:hypothetical protein